MTGLGSIDPLILLTVASILVLIIFLLTIVQNFRRKPTIIGRTAIILLVIGLLLLTLLVFQGQELGAADWAQALLMIGLVLVTAFYASSAEKQANASVKMAEEMREQRCPIVVPKAFPAKGVPLQASVEEIEKHVYSDYFEIYNKGNSPAIDLEVLLLNQEKSRLGNLKETVFSRDDAPLTFHPSGLGSHLNSTCYLVCQYLSVLPANADKKWYETWLPFIPKKSQRGDQIIIVPGELEFTESSEKKSY